jgi:hypothetical protein
MLRSPLLLLLSARAADALPKWSWDTLQTYVHCANYSGEWNEDALHTLAKQPFVVFEKYHKAFEEPQLDQAEAKIAESCRKVKEINPETDCYIYTESDWARTEWSLGHWFEAHNDSALQCDSTKNLEGKFVYTNDTLCNDWPPLPDGHTTGSGSVAESAADKGGCNGKLHHLQYLAYDFNNSLAREKWIERVTNVTATGHVDGAFIDGNRGGFSSGITGSCSAEKKAGWATGLQEAVETLAQRLGPDKTLISNYPTPDAMKLCVGGMMERGGSTEAIAAFGKKTCGLYGQQCLLDYHAQYFRAPSDGKLAGFLLGMNKYSYFGGGSGWGGTGPGACSLWLKQFPEFTKPLGEPKGNMTAAKASWDGAVCDTEPAAHGQYKNSSGCLFTREFATGTKVFVGQYLPPDNPARPTNQGKCIYWSDGTTTTDNATRCQPKDSF